LDGASVSSLAADSSLPKQHFMTSTTLQGQELTGLLIVHPGVDLVLDDVLLTGAIVSSAVMDQSEMGAYDANTAPHIVLDGNVRIDPHSALPGVAVLMPDGAVSSSLGDARVQIFGDVVAHDVELTHAGTFAGNVSAVNAQVAPSSVLDRLGIDRKGLDWSGELQLGGVQEPVFLAAVPPVTSADALSGIVDFWSAQ
jgi:hypothetical protein